ncbi:MAG TPA: MarR family winged helix-turn-helix transcriptional regulator [Stellaceae bacterium]|nr:MarR family winged helix-turn-helix transcriptional regulator [Stellaceae bacterium]
MKSLPGGTLSTDGLFVLERFVPFRLSVLANRMTRAVAGVYARRFNVSAPEWRTLAVLGRFGAMTANNVVERTAMDKVRVSRAVTRLLELGYITRRTDPLDRRRAILDLTASGNNVYRHIAPRALAVERDLLQALDPDERAAFEAAISKLEGRVASHGPEAED